MKLVTTKTFLMDSLSHDNKENIPPIPVHPSQHHHSLSEQHIQVGDYYLSALLGRGNYGEVRLARHVRTHELYAVKILPNDIFGENAYACDVRREMSILLAMQHPNIIALHEFYTEQSKLYLVMELAADGDLFTLINDTGPLPERQARTYFLQLTEAVMHCHRRGVYHRDLKPENLLLTNSTRVIKVADFGFAAMVDKTWTGSQLLRTNCGSAHYCAPEVWNGEHEDGYCGEKADAFSCGVILYCMIVGKQPFNARSEQTVLAKVNRCRVYFPDDVPFLVRELIQSLLRRDPDRRFCLERARRHPWVTGEVGGVLRPLKMVRWADEEGITPN